ncbi:MAG TPA: glutamine amidotransferase [Polyangiales bacterium]|nr:glutamine amidotransferase [Polyangiales bacterium]
MSSLVVIKTGTGVASVVAKRRDCEVWITAGTGLSSGDVQVVDVYLDAALPKPSDVPAVIVSGSPAMVTDRAPWSERTGEWLRELVALGTPVLGICYGHQLLAHTLGGEVRDNPNGRQIGTLDVTLSEHAQSDPLFGSFRGSVHVPVSHVQSVTRLPERAHVLGSTPRDPHHAVRYAENAWGVQFHPEFDSGIVRGYIDARRDQIRAEGHDPQALWDDAMDTADGTILLRRFMDVARKHARR